VFLDDGGHLTVFVLVKLILKPISLFSPLLRLFQRCLKSCNLSELLSMIVLRKGKLVLSGVPMRIHSQVGGSTLAYNWVVNLSLA
jgi:hypothetical protein